MKGSKPASQKCHAVPFKQKATHTQSSWLDMVAEFVQNL